MRYVLLHITIIVLAVTCKPSDIKDDDLGEVIASVGDRKLYMSEFKSLFDSDMEELERNVILKGYVSNWVKEQLMIEEAAKKIPKDLNLDKLVEDYRSSLMLNYYENKLVEELLDTIVTEAQQKEYYEKYKDDFKLSGDVVFGTYIKIPKGNHQSKVKKMLSDPNQTASLASYVNSQNGMIMGKDMEWLPTSTILANFQTTALRQKDLNTIHTKVISGKEYEYYVKTIDYVSEGDAPPLEYIKSKLNQVILNNRKKILIDRKKQQLYDQNYSNSNIVINID